MTASMTGETHMDILEALRSADHRGVAPPQNWTTRAADEIERLRAALSRIASYKEGPEVNSSFDEPESAKIAREALGDTCRKCGGAMTKSTAIGPTCVAGISDFPGVANTRGQTMHGGGPGHLIPCMKCKECGWSVTVGGAEL